MSKPQTIEEAHNKLDTLAQKTAVCAIIHVAAGIQLAHSQLFGIAGLWLREAAKFGGICAALAYARDEYFPLPS